jgi:osmotically-inducible protein OsmY
LGNGQAPKNKEHKNSHQKLWDHVASRFGPIRDRLLAHLKAQPWADTWLLNVTVNGGIVDLWGVTRSDIERKAIRVAAQSIPGVSAVNDNLFTRW